MKKQTIEDQAGATMVDANPATPNGIAMFMQCGKCMAELPDGESPESFARLSPGITKNGYLQVWCVRHECNVAKLKLAAGVPVPCCCSECGISAEDAPTAEQSEREYWDAEARNAGQTTEEDRGSGEPTTDDEVE